MNPAQPRGSGGHRDLGHFFCLSRSCSHRGRQGELKSRRRTPAELLLCGWRAAGHVGPVRASLLTEEGIWDTTPRPRS